MFIKLTGSCEKQAMVPIDNIACVVECKVASKMFFKQCLLDSLFVAESVDVIYEEIKTFKKAVSFIKLTRPKGKKVIVSIDSIACVKDHIRNSDIFFKQCSLKSLTVKESVDIITKKIEVARRTGDFIKLERTLERKAMVPIDNIACVIENKKATKVLFKQGSLKSITPKESISIIYKKLEVSKKLVEFINLTKKRKVNVMVSIGNIECIVEGTDESYVFFRECVLESITIKEPADSIYQKMDRGKQVVGKRKESD